MTFVPKGAKTRKMRVTLPDGRSARLTCGTRDARTADDVARMVEHFRHRREWRALEAVVTKRVTLPALYDAYRAGTVTELLERADDIDLAPLVAEWGGRGRKVTSARYLKQVRALIPEGIPFPRSRFRRKTIAAFLDGLAVAEPTKNRYKAALAQFGAWLVRREIIEANPVREAGSFSEHAPRMVWLPATDAKALVQAMTGEPRVVAALMAATGAEWQAVGRGRRRDLDLDARTFHARGGKTRWRDRIVEATDDPAWAWAWPIVEAHARHLAPNAPLVTCTERQALAAQQTACTALGLPMHRLHDWRHTYAVHAIRRGDDHQAIKRQLGHAPNSVVLYRVYAPYLSEPRRHQSGHQIEKLHEVRHAK